MLSLILSLIKNYLLCCVFSSGKDIWHYDIQVFPGNECIFNRYTFTSLPDAVMFYTENRLGSVYLKEPVSSQFLKV